MAAEVISGDFGLFWCSDAANEQPVRDYALCRWHLVHLAIISGGFEEGKLMI